MGKLIKIKAVETLKESASNVKDKRFSFFSEEDTLQLQDRNILDKNDCKDFTGYSCSEDSSNKILFNLVQINKEITIDLETTGTNYLEDEIKILGFSDGETHGFINLDRKGGIETCINFLRLLKKLDYKCLAFNIQFENSFISHHFNIELNWADDPQIMAYLLLNRPYPRLSELSAEYLGRHPKSLEEISGEKFNPVIYEREDLREEICTYCCEDCYETLLLSKELKRLLRKEGLLHLYRIDFESSLVASRMKILGISIDLDELERLRERASNYIEILHDEICTVAGFDINLKSPQQMNYFLFEVLKLDPSELKKNKSGYSLDEKGRQLLLHQHPIIEKINTLIKIIDIDNKYLSSLPKSIYLGKVHTSFDTISTTTGRLSSKNPNLQNLPNPDKYYSYGNKLLGDFGIGVRNLFIPEEGNYLISCDYSSFELRILAHLSQEPILIDTFIQNKSLHDTMTEILFDIEYDPNNPDHKAKRTVIKTINFGLIYGMTWRRLYEECRIRGMNWSQLQCQEILVEYWKRLPVLLDYICSMKVAAIKNGYTETFFGRKRYYQFSSELKKEARNKSETSEVYYHLEEVANYNDIAQLRQVGNAPVQGTNADAIRIAMKYCEEIKGINLLLQIHDELVFECPEYLLNYAKAQIKLKMESAITLDVPVIAEPKEAKRWGDTK